MKNLLKQLAASIVAKIAADFQKPKLPLGWKLTFAVLTIVGFLAFVSLAWQDEAPSDFHHALAFVLALIGVSSGVILMSELSWKKPSNQSKA